MAKPRDNMHLGVPTCGGGYHKCGDGKISRIELLVGSSFAVFLEFDHILSLVISAPKEMDRG